MTSNNIKHITYNIKYRTLNYKFKLIFISLLFVICYLLFAIPLVNAQSAHYPIPALGNCRNARECKLFCDIPQNSPACWSYGKYILNENVLGDSTKSTSELTYPVTELGNCNTASECFVYCNQPANQTTCYDFAKKRGLIKEKPKLENIIELAKKELGCKSDLECMVFCQQPDNMSSCQTFGEKYNLVNRELSKKSPPKEVVEAAKTELGCNSEEACMNICNKPENQDKCFEFAKNHNLLDKDELAQHEEFIKQEKELMEDAQKELGCNSPESCKPFCEKNENRPKCEELAKKHGLGPQKTPPEQFDQNKNPGSFRQPGPSDTAGKINSQTQSESFFNSSSDQQFSPSNSPKEKKFEKQSTIQKQFSIPGNSQQVNQPNSPKNQSTSQNDFQRMPTPLTQKKYTPSGNSQQVNQSISAMGQSAPPQVGCKTEKECREICEKNPDKCPGFPKNGQFPNPPPSGFPLNVSGRPPMENQNYIPPTGNQPPASGNNPPQNVSGAYFPPQNTPAINL